MDMLLEASQQSAAVEERAEDAEDNPRRLQFQHLETEEDVRDRWEQFMTQQEAAARDRRRRGQTLLQ